MDRLAQPWYALRNFSSCQLHPFLFLLRRFSPGHRALVLNQGAWPSPTHYAWGHLAVSGDRLGCHTWSGDATSSDPSEDCPAQRVGRAELEKLLKHCFEPP